MGKQGDPVQKGNKTMEDILGTESCEKAEKDQNRNPKKISIKSIRLRDVMRSSSQRFDPPQSDGPEGDKLSNDQWKVLIAAIEDRTGWTYQGSGGDSCCCTFP